MHRTHYQTLGVQPTSTPEEIRSAYRKLVLKHHPDRSSDPGSVDAFIKVTEAYEVLSDKARRFEYDRYLLAEEARRRQVAAPKAAPTPTPKPSAVKPTEPRIYTTPRKPEPARTGNIAADVTRLTLLFSRGRYAESETLARAILSRDARQAIPYAILGDLARSRGDFPEAAKMYAYAAQMDPRNSVYQRRHEELLSATQVTTRTSRVAENQAGNFLPALFGGGIVLVACVYVVLAKEAPLFPGFHLISSWTVGLMAMLFFSGVSAGTSLSLSSLVDRLQAVNTNSMGRMSPTVALGFVAVVNFWAAVLLYAMIGLAQRGFNYSTSRVVGATAGITLLMTVASGLSGTLEGLQVLLWGGNVAYMGALCGWMVADAFRR